MNAFRNVSPKHGQYVYRRAVRHNSEVNSSLLQNKCSRRVLGVTTWYLDRCTGHRSSRHVRIVTSHNRDGRRAEKRSSLYYPLMGLCFVTWLLLVTGMKPAPKIGGRQVMSTEYALVVTEQHANRSWSTLSREETITRQVHEYCRTSKRGPTPA